MKKLFKIITLVVLFGLICFTIFLSNLAPNGSKPYSTYIFPLSKNALENEIDSLIQADKTIFRNKNFDSTSKFYDKGRYFTINIDSVEFIFRYKGDSLDWKNSQDSIRIFLTSMNSFQKKNLLNEQKFEIVEERFLKKLRTNFTKAEY